MPTSKSEYIDINYQHFRFRSYSQHKMGWCLQRPGSYCSNSLLHQSISQVSGSRVDICWACSDRQPREFFPCGVIVFLQKTTVFFALFLQFIKCREEHVFALKLRVRISLKQILSLPESAKVIDHHP